MQVPRIFMCYYPGNEPAAEQQRTQQLIHDLHTTGAEIVHDDAKNSDTEFLQLLARDLPTCQWVIFVQTPTTMQAPRTSIIYNAAHKLLEQGTIQGMVRLIATTDESSYMVSPEWAELQTYNLYPDYAKALEQLLFAFAMADTGKVPAYGSGLISNSMNVPALPLPANNGGRNFSSPPPTYDRPLAPVPRSGRVRSTFSRKTLRNTGIVALIVLVLLGSTGAIFLLMRPKPVPNPVAGYAYFTSTGLLDGSGNVGVNDGIQVSLNNVAAPGEGYSYYAWLLPDVQQGETNSLDLGQLPALQNGVTQLTYQSSTHSNLLALGSRILITEETTGIPPANPTPDKSRRIYYAEIPQNGSASASSGSMDMGNMSNLAQLDHLRHLLSGDPELQKLSLKGGSGYWFWHNTQSLMLWATDARNRPSARGVQSDAIKILDNLDGIHYVNRDVPAKTPLSANAHDATVGLLTLDPENENPQGYVTYMGIHLQALANTPEITVSQRSQIVQISAALNQIEKQLQQMRQDAIKLVNKTAGMDLSTTKIVNKKPVSSSINPMLNDANSTATLNDMYMQSENMYYGQFDPATGGRQGGAIWIFDHIQHLAMFTIEKYGGQ
ncbi:MAG TPA: hypothetical protein VHZ51_20615 [Ktedonobacteraceae bacterium]|nr:hypothetical protein [Ktedonobacteraceae bacterium]